MWSLLAILCVVGVVACLPSVYESFWSVGHPEPGLDMLKTNPDMTWSSAKKVDTDKINITGSTDVNYSDWFSLSSDDFRIEERCQGGSCEGI